MNKETPILFSTAMVQAILEGRKTQTRRIINPQPIKKPIGFYWLKSKNKHYKNYYIILYPGDVIPATPENDRGFINRFCPYGKKGDLLWVRETFAPLYVPGGLDGFREQYPKTCPWVYKADVIGIDKLYTFKPSIHMPKEAARIWLRIKDVQVERLWDISKEDCMREGVSLLSRGKDAWKKSFFYLWQSINGSESLDANPWVWVIEFEVAQVKIDGMKASTASFIAMFNSIQ